MGKLGRVNRHIELGQQIGQCSNVVLVTMGNHYAPDAFPVLHQVANVRNYQVNAQHVFLGKHKPGINDDDVVFILHNHHVLADFT